MNWTEGNLNRHSRARKGKETLLRQKEHFAKARTGLLDANVKISPPSVSLLAFPSLSPSSVRPGALKSTSSRRRQSDDRLMSSHYFSKVHPKSPSSIRLHGQGTEDEAMRQKRRKLLLKGDWVGTNVQKPIDMEFAKSRVSPSNPWAGKKSRRKASKQKLRRLLGVANGEGHSKARLSAVDTFTPTSLRRTKVRVGSHERALGDSSNASPRSHGIQVDLSGSRGQSRYHHWRECQDRGQGCIPRSDASHRSHSSANQTPPLTTSPLLFHPVPTRPALVQLLHRQSVDSDNADSTLAQLGVDQPPVPPSQADENDVWRSFVAGPSDVSAFNAMGTSDDLADDHQRLVSPGLSQLGASKQLHDTYDKGASVSSAKRVVNDIGGDRFPTVPAHLFAEGVQPDPSDQLSSETFSDNDQITPISDYIPSRVGSDLPRPSETLENNDRDDEDLIREQNMTVGSSDEVSLLGVSSSPKLPASSSPKLLASLDMVDKATSFQKDQSGDVTIGLNGLFPHVDMPQLHGNDQTSRDGASAAVEEQLSRKRIQEEENDMWRNFVFGDSSDSLENALQEARRETARTLQPSLPSTSTYSCEESQQGFTTSSIGHESIDTRDFTEGLCNPTGDMATIGSASHVATAGASSVDLSSETTSAAVETAVRTDQATHGSSSSSSSSSAVGNNTARRPIPSDLMTSSTAEADTSTSTVGPQQLEKHREPDDCFKFARPKLFVGKKIEHVNEQRQIALSEPQIRGTNQTRRRQRRTTDGRANIRKLPNYGSDPIEEFEGDFWSDRAEKGSMFGLLDTEDGF